MYTSSLGLESLWGSHIKLSKDTAQPKKTSDGQDMDKTEPYGGTTTFAINNLYEHK